MESEGIVELVANIGDSQTNNNLSAIANNIKIFETVLSSCMTFPPRIIWAQKAGYFAASSVKPSEAISRHPLHGHLLDVARLLVEIGLAECRICFIIPPPRTERLLALPAR